MHWQTEDSRCLGSCRVWSTGICHTGTLSLTAPHSLKFPRILITPSLETSKASPCRKCSKLHRTLTISSTRAVPPSVARDARGSRSAAGGYPEPRGTRSAAGGPPSPYLGCRRTCCRPAPRRQRRPWLGAELRQHRGPTEPGPLPPLPPHAPPSGLARPRPGRDP